MNQNTTKTIFTVIALSLVLVVGVFFLKGGFGLFGSPSASDSPQNVSISEVRSTQSSISWITADRAASTVYFGTTPALGDQKTSPGLTTAHLVTLDNLQPSTTYYLMIGGSSKKYASDGPSGAVPYTLRTLAAIPETDNSTVGTSEAQTTPVKQLALATAPSPFGEVLKNGGDSRPQVLAAATDSGTQETGNGTTGITSTPQTASPLYTLLVAAVSLSLLGFGARLLKR